MRAHLATVQHPTGRLLQRKHGENDQECFCCESSVSRRPEERNATLEGDREPSETFTVALRSESRGVVSSDVTSVFTALTVSDRLFVLREDVNKDAMLVKPTYSAPEGGVFSSLTVSMETSHTSGCVQHTGLVMNQ